MTNQLLPVVQEAEGAVARPGEVYTRRWVVELILDVAGYTADKDLAAMRAVEPSCGSGAFLVVMLERLLDSAKAFGRSKCELGQAIRGYDVLASSVENARATCRSVLKEHGWSDAEQSEWCEESITHRDYLLACDGLNTADFVVGNPPYIRLEDVAPELRAAYRSSCPTMNGRADVYVGFWETALRSLKDNGVVSFICADRWMRNTYGRALRKYIVDGPFAVECSISMHGVNAFEERVAAYPAITSVRRAPQSGAVVVETKRAFESIDASLLRQWMKVPRTKPQAPHTASKYTAAVLPTWFATADGWPSGSPERLLWLEQLEQLFPALENEQTGTRIGVGVTTGADRVFLTTDDTLVEKERLVPLAVSADMSTGTYEWNGTYLVNPWNESGLVDLHAYPKLQRFLSSHEDLLKRRIMAGNGTTDWFRTADLMNLDLINRPKLLQEDIKARPSPVLEPGGRYPHHNLYWIVSDEWDLEVLGGLLLSDIVEAQIDAYCVKMRGGTLRFQAQYLRRLRLPAFGCINALQREELVRAFRRRDRRAATQTALVLYGLGELPR